MSTRTRSSPAARLVASASLVLALVVSTVPGTALAGHSPAVAAIAAPANGASFTRLQTVQFTDGSTTSVGCPISHWDWNLGGANANVQNPTRQYPLSTAPGSVEVTLRVRTQSCSTGHFSNTASITIQIVNLLPTASLSASAASVAAGVEVTFSGAASSDPDGTLSSYRFTIDGVAQPAQAGATLARTFTTAGTHTASLVVVDNNGGESATAASLQVEVVPAALDRIDVTPSTATLVATGATAFGASGFDAFGNSVAIAPTWSADCGTVDASGQYEAPATVGTCTVTATDGAVFGSATVEVVAGALASVVVSPASATLAAASSQAFSAAGYDPHGNAVAITPAWSADCGTIGEDGTYVAPTAVGACVVTASADGVAGTADVTVVAAGLASITVSGPDSVIAGSSTSFALAGADAHGNAVALAETSTLFAAPTGAGAASVCYSESNVTGCKDVLVVADALASILVSGVDVMVVDDISLFGLSGFDQYGNPVALAQASLEYRAPTIAGGANVCYTEAGVTGCRAISVVADALHAILLGGPETVVAGASAGFTVAGEDRFANPVPLATEEITYAAPTAAGPAQVCHEESGVTGCRNVTIVADALATIAVTGPASMPAGSEATFAVEGSDQFGNAVTLDATSFLFAAPTGVGAASACYTEDGVSGCAPVDVVPAALATIVLTGADEGVAGTAYAMAVAGFDAYGNAVALAIAELDVTLPTSTGVATYTYEEAGVVGEKAVLVVPDALVEISIEGPASIAAGKDASYAFHGRDQHGNAVTLAESGTLVTAPTLVGAIEVAYAEAGVSASKTVAIVPDVLASTLVTGPDTAVVGTDVTWDYVDHDQYGNVIGSGSFTITMPTHMVIEPKACRTTGEVMGCKAFTLVPGPLATITVSPPDASVVAAHALEFTARGRDQYGNEVDMAPSWSALRGAFAGALYTAPTAAGGDVVTATADGIAGSASVSVVPDVQVRLVVTGPGTVEVATAAQYAAAAFDQHDNPVAVEASWETTIGAVSADGLLTAQTTVATGEVRASAPFVTDALTVTLAPGPVASVEVSTPTSIQNLGRTVQLSATAADAYGNAVPAPELAWSTTLGTVDATGLFASDATGVATVTASAGTGVGSATIEVVDTLATSVATLRASYRLHEAMISGVTGEVAVVFADGERAAGANVTLVVSQTTPRGDLRSVTLSGVTDDGGVFRFLAPLDYRLVGDYRLDAAAVWGGNSGAAESAYAVAL